MSYVANEYNYCTPSSSVLVGDAQSVSDIRYFTLSDNVLDGSYRPVTGDVGLWGDSAADAQGILPTPFIVTVTDDIEVRAFRLQGSVYCYPVAFTVQFFNGSTLLYTISEEANNEYIYMHYLKDILNVTHYVITITKVSQPGGAARLYNIYNPAYMKRVDTIGLACGEALTHALGIQKSVRDSLRISTYGSTDYIAYMLESFDTVNMSTKETSKALVSSYNSDALSVSEASKDTLKNTIDTTHDAVRIINTDKSAILNTIDVATDTATPRIVESIPHILNTIDVTHDKLSVATEDTPTLTNVHTRMKEISRRVYGKVYITYADPMLSSETRVLSSGDAHNSSKDQVIDGVLKTDDLYFTLYDNDLSGRYKVINEYNQVGWTSDRVSDENGQFDESPHVSVTFSERPIVGLTLYFDDTHGSVPEDFTVSFVHITGNTTSIRITDNKDVVCRVTDDSFANVTELIVTVNKTSLPYTPATILCIPVVATVLYKGYQDVSDLMSIDLLEELTYEDDIEALGGVSANEITVMLDNSSHDFYFNSGSIVSSQLKRNRKIVPWLGVEVIPGEIEWYTLGTFWSHKWDVPVNGLTASVVGFDTIGLLGTTSFINHQVLIDKSIGELIEYVVDDAATLLNFITAKIDKALYDVIIPYAWFENGSHADALRKISLCYPMHIYCDRNGVICAAPQRIRQDYFYDTWSDSTNVIDKSYSSLYTTLPNIVNVSVMSPIVEAGVELVKDEQVFAVIEQDTKTLNFSGACLSDLIVDIDCDSTLSYTYEAYSWGITINFVGTGDVRSITCIGTSVSLSENSILTRRNESSIRLNGAVTRDVSSDFIQTNALADLILDRLFSLSEYDKYDANVNYRGDISLTINDPIRLKDGIAPDDRYTIKRHQLSWNGALTGSADLNT